MTLRSCALLSLSLTLLLLACTEPEPESSEAGNNAMDPSNNTDDPANADAPACEEDNSCGPELECESDADCGADQICDPCANTSCKECDTCIPGCIDWCDPKSDPTCEPPIDETLYDCDGDVDCLGDEFCDPCGAATCEGCDDCRAVCVILSCELEETKPSCPDIRPACDMDEVAIVKEGCWSCVDRTTCE